MIEFAAAWMPMRLAHAAGLAPRKVGRADWPARNLRLSAADRAVYRRFAARRVRELE